MKVFKFLIPLCLIMLAAIAMHAQGTVSEYKTTLDLDGTAIDEEVKLLVKASSDLVRVRVEGVITGGKVVVTLSDPDGQNQARLKLDAKGGRAKGQLQNTEKARPGIWIMKIENDSASGKVKINLYQN